MRSDGFTGYEGCAVGRCPIGTECAAAGDCVIGAGRHAITRGVDRQRTTLRCPCCDAKLEVDIHFGLTEVDE